MSVIRHDDGSALKGLGAALSPATAGRSVGVGLGLCVDPGSEVENLQADSARSSAATHRCNLRSTSVRPSRLERLILATGGRPVEQPAGAGSEPGKLPS